MLYRRFEVFGYIVAALYCVAVAFIACLTAWWAAKLLTGIADRLWRIDAESGPFVSLVPIHRKGAFLRGRVGLRRVRGALRR